MNITQAARTRAAASRRGVIESAVIAELMREAVSRAERRQLHRSAVDRIRGEQGGQGNREAGGDGQPTRARGPAGKQHRLGLRTMPTLWIRGVDWRVGPRRARWSSDRAAPCALA